MGAEFNRENNTRPSAGFAEDGVAFQAGAPYVNPSPETGDVGPYIPPEHEQYGLLPYSREHGGEVFSYPMELMDIDERIFVHEHGADEEPWQALIVPYGEMSYATYYAKLAAYADRFRDTDRVLADDIERLIETLKRMNVKEDWSVVRYVGSQADDDPLSCSLGLTKGSCYYWPCSKEHPEYEGVIDNEEFTSYLYPCDPASWEIVLDPTGMAARALAGDANTVHAWYIKPSELGC